LDGGATLHVTKDIGIEIGTEVLKKSLIDYLTETLSKYKGTRQSIIYFTIYRPITTRENELIEILRELMSEVGKVEGHIEETYPHTMIINIGKSRFHLIITVTKLGDILFYDELTNIFIDEVQGVIESPTLTTDDELLEALGIEKADLEDVVDATLVIQPEEKARSDDVYALISFLYDVAVQNLSSERVVVKIVIYTKDAKATNNIFNILKKLSSSDISLYKSENKLTVVLSKPTQILNKQIYKDIYG